MNSEPRLTSAGIPGDETSGIRGALVAAFCIASVEAQRHGLDSSGMLLATLALLFAIVWLSHLLGWESMSRHAPLSIDAGILSLSACSLYFALNQQAVTAEALAGVLLFWSPLAGLWWGTHYQHRPIMPYALLAALFSLLAFLFWNSDSTVLDELFLTLLILRFTRPQSARRAPPPADSFVNSRDPVTNLVSPDYFEAELAHISSISDRYQIPMSLLACRLFPDTGSDVVADGTLRRYADAISDSLRLSDTLCRWEKQTFMLLLPNTNSQQADIVRKKILLAIEPLEKERGLQQATVLHTTQHAFGEDAMSTLVTLETLLEGTR